MAAWMKNIFRERIRNWECLKALGVYQPSDVVSFRPQFPSNLELEPS
jgi:hypothetical protein